MKKLIAAAAATTLILAACGDDGGGSSGGSAAKDKLFDEMMADFEGDTEGIDVDCMRKLIDDIPDDQAVIIADNLDTADDPDAPLPDGVDESTVMALGVGMFDCFDIGDLLNE